MTLLLPCHLCWFLVCFSLAFALRTPSGVIPPLPFPFAQEERLKKHHTFESDMLSAALHGFESRNSFEILERTTNGKYIERPHGDTSLSLLYLSNSRVISVCDVNENAIVLPSYLVSFLYLHVNNFVNENHILRQMQRCFSSFQKDAVSRPIITLIVGVSDQNKAQFLQQTKRLFFEAWESFDSKRPSEISLTVQDAFGLSLIPFVYRRNDSSIQKFKSSCYSIPQDIVFDFDSTLIGLMKIFSKKSAVRSSSQLHHLVSHSVPKPLSNFDVTKLSSLYSQYFQNFDSKSISPAIFQLYLTATQKTLGIVNSHMKSLAITMRSRNITVESIRNFSISSHAGDTIDMANKLFSDFVFGPSKLRPNMSSLESDVANICKYQIHRKIMQLYETLLSAKAFEAKKYVINSFNIEAENIPDLSNLINDLQELKTKSIELYEAIFVPDLKKESPLFNSLRWSSIVGLEKLLLTMTLDDYIQRRIDYCRLLGVFSRGGRKPWTVSMHSLLGIHDTTLVQHIPLLGKLSSATTDDTCVPIYRHSLNIFDDVMRPSAVMSNPKFSRNLRSLARKVSLLHTFIKYPNTPSFFSKDASDVIEKKMLNQKEVLDGPTSQACSSHYTPERFILWDDVKDLMTK